MRFHFGFSFRPKNIIKYILLGIMGVLAFFGISQVKAAEITVDEISAGNGTNNYIYCNSNFNNFCPSSFNPLSPPYTEYAPIKYINFDFVQTLTANHSYTFDIVYEVARPVSLNDFEQESFTFWPYTGSQLNDTTIVWSQQNTYEYQTGIYYSNFHYRGQFTPTVTSNGFYTRLTLEQNESVYGIIVLSVQLVDNDSGDALINANYENTQNIISNANNNAQNIINNNDSNTQSIIDNQNQNTQSINNNLESCAPSVNLFTGGFVQGSFNVSTGGTTGAANRVRNAGYLDVSNNSYVFSLKNNSLYDIVVYVYDTSGNYLKDESNVSWVALPFTRTFAGTRKIKIGIRFKDNSNILPSDIEEFQMQLGFVATPYEPYGEIVCKPKLDTLNNSINTTNQSINDLNDTISDDTIDTTSSDSFFSNFNNNTHGLTGIVTLPLTTIQNLNNASCSPLSLTIPFISSNNNLQLPCLTPIYQSNFGTFFTLYQTIIFGFVSYYVCINIFCMVKDFKDPNKDKIEVMDL